MLKKLALIAVLAPFAALPALAQQQAPTRADVKSEAAAANKAHAIPSGDAAAKQAKPKAEKARADVKSEAAAAEKSGALAKGEEAGKQAKPKAEKARADVKSEAAAAEKAGTLPKGEAMAPAQKK